MANIRKEDRPLAQVMLRAMALNERAHKHFVLEGPVGSGKSALTCLARMLSPVAFGSLTNASDPTFWAEDLVELVPRGTRDGVECYMADPVYSVVWTKEHRVLVQKPVVVCGLDGDSILDKLDYFEFKKGIFMRIVHRRNLPMIGFYKWTSPVMVLANKPLDLDKEAFCTIHMDQADQADPNFYTKLRAEVPSIVDLLMPQE